MILNQWGNNTMKKYKLTINIKSETRNHLVFVLIDIIKMIMCCGNSLNIEDDATKGKATIKLLKKEL